MEYHPMVSMLNFIAIVFAGGLLIIGVSLITLMVCAVLHSLRKRPKVFFTTEEILQWNRQREKKNK